ncbi:Calx-beta domain-containing protein [Plantactinospora sp. KBS50]|uniref:Calx-beta domain-containing protein n=1 Tax=Plantactinospora sp. KBS50 TaxID=2024580 RepID=UPI0012FE1FA4|nr:Calx-beta domain-containing protein [Plantactinospora sp. KBS50]
MNTKLLRPAVAAIALSTAALVPVTLLGGQGSVASPACQRVVWIDPQTSVREAAGTMTMTVHTDGACSVSGAVAVTTTPGSATSADFWLPDGELHWDEGDTSNRTLSVVINNDSLAEAPIEDFQVALTAIGTSTRVAAAIGQGRILDDDTPFLLAAVDDVACLRSDTGIGPSIPTIICGQLTVNVLPVPVVFNRPAPAGLALIAYTSNGTMLAGTHYLPVNQFLAVGEGCPVNRPGPCTAGPTSVSVNVQLLAAPPPGTADNYFTMNIVPVSSGVTVVDSSARMTILS